jgi:hypothetical protein
VEEVYTPHLADWYGQRRKVVWARASLAS